MLRQLAIALVALSIAGSNLAAQELKASPDSRPLKVALGPLGTGRILESQKVGSIGLFHSDLAEVVSSSPEAERLARVFEREQMIGRPFVLLGGGALIAGLASYASRGEAVGIGGREMTAVALGGGAFMYGAARLVAAQRALVASVAAFNGRR